MQLGSPRLFVQLSAGFDDQEQIRAYRRVARALRRLLAQEPATGVVVRPELADFFLVLTPRGFDAGPPRKMNLRLELHDTEGDRRRDMDVAVTNLDEDDALVAELRSETQPVLDWLAHNWDGR